MVLEHSLYSLLSCSIGTEPPDARDPFCYRIVITKDRDLFVENFNKFICAALSKHTHIFKVLGSADWSRDIPFKPFVPTVAVLYVHLTAEPSARSELFITELGAARIAHLGDEYLTGFRNGEQLSPF